MSYWYEPLPPLRNDPGAHSSESTVPEINASRWLKHTLQVVAITLSLLVWATLAIDMAQRLSAGFGPRSAEVVDSPLGYLLGVVFESSVFVPLSALLVCAGRRKPCAGLPPARR
jgi:hypothetical protein